MTPIYQYIRKFYWRFSGAKLDNVHVNAAQPSAPCLFGTGLLGDYLVWTFRKPS